MAARSAPKSGPGDANEPADKDQQIDGRGGDEGKACEELHRGGDYTTIVVGVQAPRLWEERLGWNANARE